MSAAPGERIVSRAVPGGWPRSDGAQAQATLVAAAYHVCRWLLPVVAWEPGTRRFAVVLPSGMPGILEVSVLLEIGKAEVALRVPCGGEEAGIELIERVREQALAMAPEQEEVAVASEPADELPF